MFINTELQKIGLLVGIEIHQQLLTSKKLFCSCKNDEGSNISKKILRRLRMSRGELGNYDKSSVFENMKSKTILYSAAKNSCLVEEDEEPPHELNPAAKNIAITIATNLNSNIFNETYIMRKTVIDGSNTSGFQRSVLISSGGVIKLNDRDVKIETICLEEDSARFIVERENVKEYNLDRLGVPLIEIALAPICTTPSEIRKIAFNIGMILRTTKNVKRGLGTIRQDVNVSMNGGSIVEIKGLQNLDQLEKVIQYEIKRQQKLLKIVDIFKSKNLDSISNNNVHDVTKIIKNYEMKQCGLENNYKVMIIKMINFIKFLNYERSQYMKIYEELIQIARFFRINQIYHSDDAYKNEIAGKHLDKIMSILKINHKDDGFILIKGNEKDIDIAIEYLIKRINESKITVPSETRKATKDGRTVFMRPKSGADRMYPETDLPPIIITKEEIELANHNKYKSWEESITHIKKKYGLRSQLAEQMFDSEYLELFEHICKSTKVSPNFVASSLCSTITKLQRENLGSSHLNEVEILNIFNLLSEKKITNESVEMIFRGLMSKKLQTADEYIHNASKINDEQVNLLIDELINNSIDFICKEKDRSVNKLMGRIMKDLRGKVDGKKINQLLQKKIYLILQND